MIAVTLTDDEIAVLDRQDPSTKNNGGWQNLLVSFQEKLNRPTNTIVLTPSDIERIRRYAFTYGNGGWEDRLLGVFGRTLGPTLGGQHLPSAA